MKSKNTASSVHSQNSMPFSAGIKVAETLVCYIAFDKTIGKINIGKYMVQNGMKFAVVTFMVGVLDFFSEKAFEIISSSAKNLYESAKNIIFTPNYELSHQPSDNLAGIIDLINSDIENN